MCNKFSKLADPNVLFQTQSLLIPHKILICVNKIYVVIIPAFQSVLVKLFVNIDMFWL